MNSGGLLEIRVGRGSSENYPLELQFDDLASQGQTEPKRGIAPISLQELLARAMEPNAYGKALTGFLFHEEHIRTYLSNCQAIVEGRQGVLRINVVIDPAAPELHALRWELLIDPASKAPLATSERVYSRDFSSAGIGDRYQCFQRVT